MTKEKLTLVNSIIITFYEMLQLILCVHQYAGKTGRSQSIVNSICTLIFLSQQDNECNCPDLSPVCLGKVP